MIQNYLSANLLSVTDDGDFKKLKKSADEIAKKLAKNKTKIVSYTLSAIDPDISVENPDIVEVKEAIIKNWSTFTNNAKDTPLTYIRAVIFEVLSNLSEDINHAMLIWFASRNIVQYHKLIDKEKEIIFEFLSKLGNDINQKANKEWTLSNESNTNKISIELKEVTNYLINNDTLKKYLEDASGPTNSVGVANFDSPNPYWSNSSQNWSYQFAPRATKGIKTVVDTSLKSIVTVVNENRISIQNNLNKVVEQIQKDQIIRGKPLQIRSELLWWKEAAYSSSMDKGYKEIDKSIIGVSLAYDYASFIPPIYPKSADYFLKETYNNLKGSIDNKITFEEYLKNIHEHSDELKNILPESDILNDRPTLLLFITGLIWNKYQLTQFENLVGIPIGIQLSETNIVTWLFHDFELMKILNTK
ncbi:GTPase-associated system all-helical protein GASH [Chryseobacterium sp. APV1]|uniref:GTPase-associated system all-helical protein GASH n=1 Tax=Chryseobacterium urinae TaxID=3058400 RepID=A0ABT8U386_9FLAO|nr:GTPase-associated system all-helical protein GASH [Chryseobacterium sp. APV1]MDO3425524.1 GTPase-associated system all-helical protein GASH [Chryseobacterium sp. APV1]